MSRLTRLTILLAVGVVAISMAGPAWAKGGSYLYFDRLYYSPWETVHLHTEFRTDVVGWQTGSVEDGPFYAYLLPLRPPRHIHIDPPRIPKAAVLLGPIHIEPGERKGVWSASLAFVVPRVEPGDYWLDMCNDPCRHDSVGDLQGGTFQITATAEEARLMNLLEPWVGQMIEAWLPETDTSLRPQFEAYRVDDALRDTRTRLELSEQLEGLRAEMAVVRGEFSGREEAGLGMGPGLWLAGWTVAAATAAMWWASSRRRSSERVRGRPTAVWISRSTRS